MYEYASFVTPPHLTHKAFPDLMNGGALVSSAAHDRQGLGDVIDDAPHIDAVPHLVPLGDHLLHEVDELGHGDRRGHLDFLGIIALGHERQLALLPDSSLR